VLGLFKSRFPRPGVRGLELLPMKQPEQNRPGTRDIIGVESCERSSEAVCYIATVERC